MSAAADPPRAFSRKALDVLLGPRMRKAHGLVMAHWARWFAARSLDITPVQGGVLLLVRDNPGIQPVQLAGILGIEAPTMSQTTAPLLAKGYLRRERSAMDGRALALHLSEAGRRIAAGLDAVIMQQEAALLAPLSPAERTQLFSLLDRVLLAGPEALATAADVAGSGDRTSYVLAE